MFEVIGRDGTLHDSTLGYTDKWLDQLLPDTVENTVPSNHKHGTPLTPIVSLKRNRREVDSPTAIEVIGVERELKRRRTGEEEDVHMRFSPNGIASSINDRPFALTDKGTKLPGLYNESVEEETIDPRELALERLIPRNLPVPLRNGRVFLRFGPVKAAQEEMEEIPGLYEEDGEETWEWIPPADENVGIKVSTLWNPTQARWRRVAEERSLEHLGAADGRPRISNPDRLGGNILRRGQCHYNDTHERWEIDFGPKYKDTPWVVKWDTAFGRWEWTWLDRN